MRLTQTMAAAALVALFALTHGSVAADGERAAGSVSGMIRGPDGKPAVGVTVKLVPDGQIKARGGQPATEPADDEDDKPAKKKQRPGFTATTGTDGRFRFDSVPAASYRISASLSEVGSVRKNLSVTAGRNYPITMQLKRKV